MTESDPTGSRGSGSGAGEGGERQPGARSRDPGGARGDSGRESKEPGKPPGAERKAKRRSRRRKPRPSGDAASSGPPAAEASKGARGPRRAGRARAGRSEPAAPRRRNLLGTALLVVALAGLAIAAFFIFLPFLSTLIAAILITTVAYPLFTKVLTFVGSERRGLASGISCVLVILLVVLPAMLCGVMVAKEVHDWVEERKSPAPSTADDGAVAGSAPVDGAGEEGGAADEPDGDGPEETAAWWERLVDLGTAEFHRQVSQLRRELRALPRPPEAASPGGAPADPAEPDAGEDAKPAFAISLNAIADVARWATGVFGLLLAGIAGVVVKCLLMLFIMFYFFKDGPRIIDSVRRALAVDPAYQEKMIEKFKVVSVGMLRGILATAATQGVVAGIAFTFLGLKPFLFGTLVALCALVPVAGTGLVTLPLAMYFLVNAQYGHAAAAAVIAVLISSLDNILRPLFVEGDLKLHPVWILLSILGGVGCFGVLGLILGPMVVVLLRTVLEFVAEESKARALERS